MNKQKQTYLSPETEPLVIRFEGEILTISGGAPGAAGADLIQGNSFDFGDDD